MKRFLTLSFLIFCVVVFFAGCGGDNGDAASPDTGATKPPATEKKAGDSRENSEGTVVAKEILATFDSAVKEMAELVKDKPEPAEVKPKLQEVYKKYVEKMTALNGKYLALKEKGIQYFGHANIYLGENRGKRVFEKSKLLGDISYYYDSKKNDKEVAKLLSKDLIQLLEIAVKR